MREKRDIRINKIPSPTWRWLSLNDHSLSGVEIPERIAVDIDIPSGVEIKEIPDFTFEDITTGMGEDMTALAKASGAPVHYLCTKKDRSVASPVWMNVLFDDSSSQYVGSQIELKENSSMTVIMDMGMEEEAAGLGASLVKYKVASGAHLTLVQLIHTYDDYSVMDDIGGECDENGRFTLIQIVIGSGKVYLGARTALNGKRSALETKLAYLVDHAGYLDVNYVADHFGKKTSSDIMVNGVLRDESKKTFRGTIDFKKGCAGAVGSEIEDVILMDDGVSNQTIPVILCAEEDVEGSHGATIGKLPEDMLFYMTSRGMELEQIYEMMARARIEMISDSLSSPELREKISDILDDKADMRREGEL